MARSATYTPLIKDEIKCLLFGLLTTAGILLCSDMRSQTSDTTRTINFPLLHEDLSLYDFAEVRMETGKTEKPPADITKRKFQLVKKIFAKDEFHFPDSVKSFWIKIQVANNQSNDTSIALRFWGGVTKAVLYKAEDDKIIQIGKTGFFIARLKRTIFTPDNRIDLALKAHTTKTYFIQVILFHGIFLPKMPVLQNIANAEMKDYKKDKDVNRPNLLWNHFFTGIFFMFFVFGFIKYLVLGKDKAYLYYALLGLFSALMAIAQSEYPPLELPWFENLRGIELYDLLLALATLMQGLFIIEILHLKNIYPRITLAAKWFLFSGLFFASLYTTLFIINKEIPFFLFVMYVINAHLSLLFMISWVIYLARRRKGFYRFIFLGAVTISVAYTLKLILAFFNLYYLLPGWFGDDGRGKENHFMQIALLIDMCFYFTGLAYRDRQVEKDKNLLENDLKLQHLESEKTKAEFEQHASQLEMQALRAQMNPHFIFNSLNSINRFILQNNKAHASEYLTKFSKLMRLILQNSQASLIPLESELESLQLYLELEAVRFDHHFEFKITVEDDLDISSLKVPPLIIQPYAENAIWHGLMHKEEKGHLEIEVFQQEDILCCRITDDGVGRMKAAELKSKSASSHKSMGMQITASRIEMMHQTKQIDTHIQITDLVLPDGTAGGTEVLLKIPIMQ